MFSDTRWSSRCARRQPCPPAPWSPLRTLAGVDDPHAVVRQVDGAEDGVVGADRLAEGGVERVDRAVALGGGHQPSRPTCTLTVASVVARTAAVRTSSSASPSGGVTWSVITRKDSTSKKSGTHPVAAARATPRSRRPPRSGSPRARGASTGRGRGRAPRRRARCRARRPSWRAWSARHLRDHHARPVAHQGGVEVLVEIPATGDRTRVQAALWAKTEAPT